MSRRRVKKQQSAIPVHNAAVTPYQEPGTKQAQQKPQDTQYEGVRYVTMSGLVFSEPTYDVTTLKNYSKSYYGASLVNKLLNLLFTGDLTVSVTDAAGNEDEELTQAVQSMCYNTGLWTEMRASFVDTCWYGVYISVPVWKWINNQYTLVDIVRLPPESFGDAPPGATDTYSDLMKGIVLNTQGQEEYWQTIQGRATKITSTFVVKNPLCSDLASEPIFLPLLQVFAYLKFSWEATAQAINRIGAPILFIRVTNGTEDDINYADKVLKNWGKNQAFQLRENMELVNPNLGEPSTPMQAIDALGKLVIDYFSPAAFIQNTNATLSSSDVGSANLMYAFIRGMHSWLEDSFERLLETFLTANGYEGYAVTITLPTPETDKTELNLKRAETGDKVQALTLNERRELLGLPPADETQISTIQTEYTARQNPGAGFVQNAMRFYNAVDKKKSRQ